MKRIYVAVFFILLGGCLITASMLLPYIVPDAVKYCDLVAFGLLGLVCAIAGLLIARKA